MAFGYMDYYDATLTITIIWIAIAVGAGLFLAWTYTKPGKKWLKSL